MQTRNEIVADNGEPAGRIVKFLEYFLCKEWIMKR